MLSEFELIRRYFAADQLAAQAAYPHLALGIGDDCALLQPNPGMQLAISSDMLVSGRHFFPDVDPASLGHKCLAVNLSDLAAMGARPLGFTLSLALPEANPEWLMPFSSSLLSLARHYRCPLIGGDTTRGPLTISITIFGELPAGQAMRRDAAKVGDDIWISGALGDARLALAAYRNELKLDPLAHQKAAQRMHLPTPRVELGIALRELAHATLDVSDGLCGDLQHILQASQLGAVLDLAELPVGEVLRSQTQAIQTEFCLNGGDDYELCFTAPPTNRAAIQALANVHQTPLSRVGHICADAGLRLLDRHGQTVHWQINSFDHFR